MARFGKWLQHHKVPALSEDEQSMSMATVERSSVDVDPEMIWGCLWWQLFFQSFLKGMFTLNKVSAFSTLGDVRFKFAVLTIPEFSIEVDIYKFLSFVTVHYSSPIRRFR